MKKKPARKRASKKSAVKPKPQKLSKQEVDLLKVYDSYWDSYTKGDIKSISNLLIEDYNQVGSAETEFFTNKKQAVKFLHDTIDQVAGKAELRNRLKKVDYLDNFVLISEQCDLYALNDGEWMFYSKFRASTVMQQRKGKWKIIHQHSSVPDLKALEGENLAIDKIAAENQQLREAVKRRTVELENKYRELEIEAALERVRVRAMAMHHSSELSEVAAVLFKQISLLTKTPNRFNIGIVNEKEKSFDIWLTDQKGHSVNQRFVGYSAKSPVIANMFQAWKTKKKLRIKDLYGSELRNWIKYMHGELGIPFDMKQVKDHRYINSIFFSHGFIGTTTNEPIHSEVQQLLERFAKVFQQTYTRFLDLQKAESQAREAQIEAALERIRAASMAMHNSNELIKVVRLMDRAIRELGIDINGIQIVTDFSDIKKGMNVWLAVEGVDYLKKFHNPYIDHPTHHKLRQTLKDNQQFFTEKYSRVDKNRFLRFLYKHSDFRKIPKERKEFTLDALWWVRSSAINKNSILAFHRYYDKEFDEKENEILKRFGKAFEQSYTRFLDLQKAEAQAIEAQIEAALERVRSRSMGMQNTTEMQQVANETREQLLSLGLKIDALAMSGVIDNEADYDVWVGGAISQKPLRIPYNNNTRVQRDYNKVIKERPELFTKTYSGKIMKDYFRDLMATNTFNPEIEKFMLECKAFTTTLTFMKNSGMQIVRYTDQPFSDADNNIVIRFGKVFEQAYIRFLDLQNSEAQAREAQIEAALERVRARTMAMHVSEDVSEATGVLFKEIEIIGLNSMACGLNIIEDKDKLQTWTTKRLGENLFQVSGTLKLEHPSVVKLYKDWKSKKDTSIYKLKGDEVKKFYDGVYKQSDYKTPRSKKLPKILVLNNFIIPEGSLWVFTEEEIDQYRASVLKRFATVFSLTYRRYKDLQNSEAQAREAQIEAALERVRARTMAMHDSAELGEVAAALFEQISSLTYAPDRFQIAIVKEEDKSFDIWVTEQGGRKLGKAFVFKSPESPVVDEVFQAWRKKQKSLIQHLSGKKLNEWIKYVSQVAGIPFNKAQMVKDRYINSFFFSHGCIGITTNESPEAEALTLIERFVKVFQQTYTRFLDLQKAEAQAREAQIELALERVRANTMAMQKSEELAEIVSVLFKQLLNLGLTLDQLRTCGITTFHPSEPKGEIWITEKGAKITNSFTAPFNEAPAYKTIYRKWKNGEDFLELNLKAKDFLEHLKFVKKYSNVPDINLKEIKMKYKEIFFHVLYFSQGYLFIISYEELTEHHELFKRFGNVFQQTYTRFLDLQKAEAQAREAQIELALERVRARTMAMQKSEELKEVIQLVYDQFVQLNIHIEHTGFILDYKTRDDMHIWLADKNEVPAEITIPYFDSSHWNSFIQARRKGTDFFANHLSFKEKNKFYRSLFKLIPNVAKKTREYYLGCPGLAIATVLLDNVGLYIENFSGIPYTAEENSTLMRFGKVFQQTYTRFLDLQKAEAQARESQIELSLERIRAQALAMRVSADLLDIVVTMRTEFVGLGHEAHYFWHMRWLPERYEKAMTSGDGARIGMVMELPRHMHGDIKLLADWEKSKENTVVYVMDAGAAINYVDKMVSLGDFKQVDPNAPTHDDIRHIGGLTFIMARTTHGEIGYSLPGMKPDVPKGDLATLVRFAGAFDLAYKRFEDLLKTEAREKEAIRQASLDRVRAEIASMRTTKDLERITPLIWKELTILNIPFIRCGVFIMDEPQQLIHTFLSTPDGKAIAAFHLPYDAPGRTGEILVHWINKQVYVNHWDEAAFSELGDLLVQQGALSSKEAYLSTVPKDGIYLHCLPFMQGMLYVGNNIKLNNNDIHLIQSVADAFSTAYARYEDFNKLELAKQQVDKALVELKQAQTQLVQSEKMASLGELTAGIAHEIQNPLNFVNNFSEVSNELLVEMKEEIEKGNVEEVKLLAQDVIENLEKILHHGKRADGIVKGMLQHSRSSSGTKEPTDINALADEYLRLAFHGLRAKDKTFNAKFDTDFDSGVGKVNVIPQDIGRVVLNLITNAFYVVSEKAQAGIENYKPAVLVSTIKDSDKILIKVKDNGNGIPDAVKEKIFQPFFTTKPTGQGTGLGLSLSYDIVKAHGGELKVQSEEGKGSEFIISLPLV